jgi:hypothetical protein
MKLIHSHPHAQRHLISWAALFVLSMCLLSPQALAQKLPSLEAVPAYLPQEQQTTFNQRRQRLEDVLTKFQADGQVFNAKDANDQTDADFNSLQARSRQYIQAAKTFNTDLLTAEKSACPHTTDASVVDLCGISGIVTPIIMPWGSDVPRVEEIERSPAADMARDGLQAVVEHNWPLALSLWQKALRRDPDNAALKRSVDLAQWMVDSRLKEAESRKVIQPSLDAIRQGDQAALKEEFVHIRKADPHVQLPKDSDMAFLYDVMGADVEKIPQAREATLAQLQKAHPDLVVPKDSDMEFLFSAQDQAPAIVRNDALFHQLNNLSQQQSALDHSVAQDLYDKALFQFMVGDDKGYNAILKQAMEASRKARLSTPSASDSIHN